MFGVDRPLAQTAALAHRLPDGLAAVGGQPLVRGPGGHTDAHPLGDGRAQLLAVRPCLAQGAGRRAVLLAGQTQQQVLSLIVKKVLSNPQKIGKYIEIFSQYVKSDMPLETMLWFAEPALGFDLSTGLQSATLPGDPDVRYQGSRWHYQLYPDQTLDILNGFLNPYTTPMTEDMLNIFEVA